MVVDETSEKAGHICFRKCTIEDLAELRALSSRTFFETFAAQNKPEDMEAYLKDAFSEEKMRAELLESGSTFYFLLVDSELAGYLKLNECGAQTDIHSPDSLEIERIYLDKHFQGKGLGNCLMDKAAVAFFDLFFFYFKLLLNFRKFSILKFGGFFQIVILFCFLDLFIDIFNLLT